MEMGWDVQCLLPFMCWPAAPAPSGFISALYLNMCTQSPFFHTSFHCPVVIEPLLRCPRVSHFSLGQFGLEDATLRPSTVSPQHRRACSRYSCYAVGLSTSPPCCFPGHDSKRLQPYSNHGPRGPSSLSALPSMSQYVPVCQLTGMRTSPRNGIIAA